MENYILKTLSSSCPYIFTVACIGVKPVLRNGLTEHVFFRMC